jgi:hypothetical protein
LHKGDPDRGSIILVVVSRGQHHAVLERMLASDGSYRWQLSGSAESAGSVETPDFLARRARSDPDLWLIELDTADPERFIAETTAAG